MLQVDPVINPEHPLKIAFASSEVAGFAKTGGLADVVAALPRALASLGHDCIVIMPLYRCIRLGKVVPEMTELRLSIPIRNHMVNGTIWKATLPGTNIPVYLIAQPEYFERDNRKNGTTFYQYTKEDGKLADYEDNCERYVFFCRAVLETLRLIDYWPNVLHCNDWHTGLVPTYLKETYRNHFTPAFRPLYENIRTVFTIHNIAYQGVFWHHDMPVTGLPWELFNYRQLEFYGHLNFLKAGLVWSDCLTAVSPTYAEEIQTPAYGCGLQGVLFERRGDLHGIVNGVDYQVWNPLKDRHIAANYNLDSVEEGKTICKRHLQQMLDLPVDANVPLIGMISRLASQKGWDLVRDAAHDLLQENVQLVVLGDGDNSYKEMLRQLEEEFPQKVAVRFAFDEQLAHHIEAGADMFLMPSLFEPCGLNQMYSLKYGTVPIVRHTGGLADTVVDTTPQTLSDGTATGFAFALPTPMAMLGAIQRAIIFYHTQRRQWLEIMRNGMRQDWSWENSARQYEALYRDVVQKVKTSVPS